MAIGKKMRGRASCIEFRTLVKNERFAFDLLHFFSHLDGSGFKQVMTIMETRRDLIRSLNPRIFEILTEAK